MPPHLKSIMEQRALDDRHQRNRHLELEGELLTSLESPTLPGRIRPLSAASHSSGGGASEDHNLDDLPSTASQSSQPSSPAENSTPPTRPAPLIRSQSGTGNPAVMQRLRRVAIGPSSSSDGATGGSPSSVLGERRGSFRDEQEEQFRGSSNGHPFDGVGVGDGPPPRGQSVVRDQRPVLESILSDLDRNKMNPADRKMCCGMSKRNVFWATVIFHMVLFYFVVGIVLALSESVFLNTGEFSSVSVEGSLKVGDNLSAKSLTVDNDLDSSLLLVSSNSARLLFRPTSSSSDEYSIHSRPGSSTLLVERSGSVILQFTDMDASTSTSSTSMPSNHHFHPLGTGSGRASGSLPPLGPSVGAVDGVPRDLNSAVSSGRSSSGRSLLQTSENGTDTDTTASRNVEATFYSPQITLGDPPDAGGIVFGRSSARTGGGQVLEIRGQDGSQSTSNIGGDGGMLLLRAGNGGTPSNRPSGAGGNVEVRAGVVGTGTASGGNVLLTAGRGGDGVLTRHGHVVATGRSLQIRPPPLSSGGVESSELRFALDSDGTKYFTIRASSSELAFYNFNQEKIFAFPAVGDFVFENAVNFGFELKVSSSENDAVLTAITTSPGDAAKVSLINGVNTAELSLEPSELALSTGGQRIALRPGGGVGVEVHSLLQVSSTITSASGNFLQLQSATNEIRVGQSTGSVTITRTPLTSGGVGSSTTISGQDSSLGTGGDLLLRAGLGSTVPGNVIIAGNTGGKVELGASTGATLVHSDMAVNQDLAVVGEATFSSGVSVSGDLTLRSDRAIKVGPGSTLVLGDTSQGEVTLRRPDGGSDTGGDLKIRAGTGTTTNGNLILGDLVNNRRVTVVSTTETIVDSAGTVVIGASASSVSIGSSTRLTAIQGLLTAESFGTSKVESTGDLTLQPSSHTLLLGVASNSILVSRPSYSGAAASGFATTIQGQSHNGGGQGGDLFLNAGSGTSGGRVRVGASSTLEIVLSALTKVEAELRVSEKLTVSGDFQLANNQRVLVPNNLMQFGPADSSTFTLRRSSPSSGSGGDLQIDAGPFSGSGQLGQLFLGSSSTRRVVINSAAGVTVDSLGTVEVGTGVGTVDVRLGRSSQPMFIDADVTVTNHMMVLQSGVLLTNGLVRTASNTNLELRPANSVLQLGSTTLQDDFVVKLPTLNTGATHALHILGQDTNSPDAPGNVIVDAGKDQSDLVPGGTLSLGTSRASQVILGGASNSVLRLNAPSIMINGDVTLSNDRTIVSGDAQLRLGPKDTNTAYVLHRADIQVSSTSAGGSLRVRGGRGNGGVDGNLHLGDTAFRTPSLTMAAGNVDIDASPRLGLGTAASTTVIDIGNAASTVTIYGTLSVVNGLQFSGTELLANTIKTIGANSDLSLQATSNRIVLGTDPAFSIVRPQHTSSAGQATHLIGQQGAGVNPGGDVSIDAGSGVTSNLEGAITLGATSARVIEIGKSSAGTSTRIKSPVLMLDGDLQLTSGKRVTIANGDQTVSFGADDDVLVQLIRTGRTAGVGGDIALRGGTTLSGNGGSTLVAGGDGNSLGGSVTIRGGVGAVANGNVVIGVTSTPQVEISGASLVMESTVTISMGTNSAGAVNIGRSGNTLTISSSTSATAPAVFESTLRTVGLLTAQGGLTSPSAGLSTGVGVTSPLVRSAAGSGSDLQLAADTHVLRLGTAGAGFLVTMPVSSDASNPASSLSLSGGENNAGQNGGSLRLDGGVGASPGAILIGTARPSPVTVGHASSTTTLASTTVQVTQLLRTTGLEVQSSMTVTDVLLNGRILSSASTPELRLGQTDSTEFIIRRDDRPTGAAGNLRIQAGIGSGSTPSSNDGSILVGAPDKRNKLVSVEATSVVVDASVVTMNAANSGDISIGTTSSKEILLSGTGKMTRVLGSLQVVQNLEIVGALSVSSGIVSTTTTTTNAVTSISDLTLESQTGNIFVRRIGGGSVFFAMTSTAGAGSLLTVAGQQSTGDAGGDLNIRPGAGLTRSGDLFLGTTNTRNIVIGSGGSPSLTLSSAVNTVSGDFVTSGTSTFNGAVTMANTLQVNSPLLSPSNVFFLGDSSSTAAVRLQTVDLPGSAASGGKDLRISPGAGGGGQPTGRLYLGDATPSPGTRSVNVEGDVFNVNTNSMSLQAENTAGSIALGTVSGHSVSISKSGKNTSIQGTLSVLEAATFSNQVTGQSFASPSAAALVFIPTNNQVLIRGGQLNDLQLKPDVQNSGVGRAFFIHGQESATNNGGNLVLVGGVAASGFTPGSVLVGPAPTPSVVVGHAGATVTLSGSALRLLGSLSLPSSVRVTSDDHTLRVGVNDEDFTLLHAATSTNTNTFPKLTIRGPRVENLDAPGTFRGGDVHIRGGDGDSGNRGAVFADGSSLTLASLGTTTVTSSGKVSITTLGDADFISTGNMVVNSNGGTLRLGMDSSSVTIGKGGTTTLIQSALTVNQNTVLTTVTASALATFSTETRTPLISSTGTLTLTPTNNMILNPTTGVVQIGTGLSGNIVLEKFPAAASTAASSFTIRGQTTTTANGGALELEAGIGNLGESPDSALVTASQGVIRIGTKVGSQILLGKSFSTTVVQSGTLVLQGHLRIPSTSFLDTTANTLLVKEESGQPLTIRRPDGGAVGSDLTIRAGASSNANDHGDLFLGDLNQNKDVFLNAKTSIEADTLGTLRLGATSAQTVILGNNAANVVIAAASLTLAAGTGTGLDTVGALELGNMFATSILMGNPSTTLAEIEATLIDLKGFDRVKADAPTVDIGTGASTAVTVGRALTNTVQISGAQVTVTAGTSISLNSATVNLGVAAGSLTVAIGNNNTPNVQVRAQNIVCTGVLTVSTDATTVNVGTTTATNLFVGRDAATLLRQRAIDVDIRSMGATGVTTVDSENQVRVGSQFASNVQVGRAAADEVNVRAGSILLTAGPLLRGSAVTIEMGVTVAETITVGRPGALTLGLLSSAVTMTGGATVDVQTPMLRLGTDATGDTILMGSPADMQLIQMRGAVFNLLAEDACVISGKSTLDLGLSSVQVQLGGAGTTTNVIGRTQVLDVVATTSAVLDSPLVEIGVTTGNTISVGRSTANAITLAANNIAVQGQASLTAFGTAMSLGNGATTSFTVRSSEVDVLSVVRTKVDAGTNLDLGATSALEIQVGRAGTTNNIRGDAANIRMLAATLLRADGAQVEIGPVTATSMILGRTGMGSFQLLANSFDMQSGGLVTLDSAGNEIRVGSATASALVLGRTNANTLVMRAQSITLQGGPTMVLDAVTTSVGVSSSQDITVGRAQAETLTGVSKLTSLQGVNILTLSGDVLNVGTNAGTTQRINVGATGTVEMISRAAKFDWVAGGGGAVLDAGTTINIGTTAATAITVGRDDGSTLNLRSGTVAATASTLFRVNAPTINIGQTTGDTISIGTLAASALLLRGNSAELRSQTSLLLDCGTTLSLGAAVATDVTIGNANANTLTLRSKTTSISGDALNVGTVSTPVLTLGSVATTSLSASAQTVSLDAVGDVRVGSTTSDRVLLGQTNGGSALLRGRAEAIELAAGVSASLDAGTAVNIATDSANTLVLGRSGTTDVFILGASLNIETNDLALDAPILNLGMTQATEINMGSAATTLLVRVRGNDINLTGQNSVSIAAPNMVFGGGSTVNVDIGQVTTTLVTVRAVDITLSAGGVASLDGGTSTEVGTQTSGPVVVGTLGMTTTASVRGDTARLQGVAEVIVDADMVSLGRTEAVDINIGTTSVTGTVRLEGGALSMVGDTSSRVDAPTVTVGTTAAALVSVGNIDSTNNLNLRAGTVLGQAKTLLRLDGPAVELGRQTATSIVLGLAGTTTTLQGFANTVSLSAATALNLQSGEVNIATANPSTILNVGRDTTAITLKGSSLVQTLTGIASVDAQTLNLGTNVLTSSITIGFGGVTTLRHVASAISLEGGATATVEAVAINIGLTSSTIQLGGTGVTSTLGASASNINIQAGQEVVMDAFTRISIGFTNCNNIRIGHADTSVFNLAGTAITTTGKTSITTVAPLINVGTTTATAINLGRSVSTVNVQGSDVDVIAAGRLRLDGFPIQMGSTSTGISIGSGSAVTLALVGQTTSLTGTSAVNVQGPSVNVGTTNGDLLAIGRSAATSLDLKARTITVVGDVAVSIQSVGPLALGNLQATSVNLGNSAIPTVIRGDTVDMTGTSTGILSAPTLTIGGTTMNIGTGGSTITVLSSSSTMTASGVFTVDGNEIRIGRTTATSVRVGTKVNTDFVFDAKSFSMESAQAISLDSDTVMNLGASTTTVINLGNVNSQLNMQASGLSLDAGLVVSLGTVTATEVYIGHAAVDPVQITGDRISLLAGAALNLGVSGGGATAIAMGGISSAVVINGDTLSSTAQTSITQQAPTMSIGAASNTAMTLGTPTATDMELRGDDLTISFAGDVIANAALISVGTAASSGELNLGHVANTRTTLRGDELLLQGATLWSAQALTMNVGVLVAQNINIGRPESVVDIKSLSMNLESAGIMNVGTASATEVHIGRGAATLADVTATRVDLVASTTLNLGNAGADQITIGAAGDSSVDIRSNQFDIRADSTGTLRATTLNMGTVGTTTLNMGQLGSTVSVLRAASFDFEASGTFQVEAPTVRISSTSGTSTLLRMGVLTTTAVNLQGSSYDSIFSGALTVDADSMLLGTNVATNSVVIGRDGAPVSIDAGVLTVVASAGVSVSNTGPMTLGSAATTTNAVVQAQTSVQLSSAEVRLLSGADTIIDSTAGAGRMLIGTSVSQTITIGHPAATLNLNMGTLVIPNTVTTLDLQAATVNIGTTPAAPVINMGNAAADITTQADEYVVLGNTLARINAPSVQLGTVGIVATVEIGNSVGSTTTVRGASVVLNSAGTMSLTVGGATTWASGADWTVSAPTHTTRLEAQTVRLQSSQTTNMDADVSILLGSTTSPVTTIGHGASTLNLNMGTLQTPNSVDTISLQAAVVNVATTATANPVITIGKPSATATLSANELTLVGVSFAKMDATLVQVGTGAASSDVRVGNNAAPAAVRGSSVLVASAAAMTLQSASSLSVSTSGGDATFSIGGAGSAQVTAAAEIRLRSASDLSLDSTSSGSMLVGTATAPITTIGHGTSTLNLNMGTLVTPGATASIGLHATLVKIGTDSTADPTILIGKSSADVSLSADELIMTGATVARIDAPAVRVGAETASLQVRLGHLDAVQTNVRGQIAVLESTGASVTVAGSAISLNADTLTVSSSTGTTLGGQTVVVRGLTSTTVDTNTGPLLLGVVDAASISVGHSGAVLNLNMGSLTTPNNVNAISLQGTSISIATTSASSPTVTIGMATAVTTLSGNQLTLAGTSQAKMDAPSVFIGTDASSTDVRVGNNAAAATALRGQTLLLNSGAATTVQSGAALGITSAGDTTLTAGGNAVVGGAEVHVVGDSATKVDSTAGSVQVGTATGVTTIGHGVSTLNLNMGTLVTLASTASIGLHATQINIGTDATTGPTILLGKNSGPVTVTASNLALSAANLAELDGPIVRVGAQPTSLQVRVGHADAVQTNVRGTAVLLEGESATLSLAGTVALTSSVDVSLSAAANTITVTGQDVSVRGSVSTVLDSTGPGGGIFVGNTFAALTTIGHGSSTLNLNMNALVTPASTTSMDLQANTVRIATSTSSDPLIQIGKLTATMSVITKELSMSGDTFVRLDSPLVQVGTQAASVQVHVGSTTSQQTAVRGDSVLLETIQGLTMTVGSDLSVNSGDTILMSGVTAMSLDAPTMTLGTSTATSITLGMDAATAISLASSTLTLQSSGALTIDTTAAASPIAIGTTTSQDVSIGHGSSVVAVSADTMTVAGTTSLALDAPSVSVGVNTAAATPALALGKSTTAMTINADTVAATMTSTFSLDAPDVTINTSPANSVIIGSADLTTLTALSTAMTVDANTVAIGDTLLDALTVKAISVVTVEAPQISLVGSVFVDGDFEVTGTCTATCASDARLKTAVQPLESILDRVLRLQPVSYQWNELGVKMGKSSHESELGFLAQEVQQLFPELVGSFHNSHLGEDTFLSLRYDRFAPVVVAAIREQHEEVELLRQRVKALEAQNASLMESVKLLLEKMSPSP